MKLIRTLLLITSAFLTSAIAHAENDVRVEYAKPVGAIETAINKELNTSNAVGSVTTFIDDYFQLPEPLVFFIGGEEGPLYDGAENRILIPYSFVTEIKERFTQASYKETGVTAEEATNDALMHTLFHEFAHAAIVMYELPVLGKEEDAADALATILLIEFFDDGQEIALSAADLFDLESDDRDTLGDEDFWDEHSLDDQRYFSTLCHVYGSDPEQYAAILEDGALSEERAELCIEEYEYTTQSWFKVLEPYIQDNKAD